MELRTLINIVNFDSTRKAALCTQVRWAGSVPRKDYPMMLVYDSGEIIGTVGGGALEHSVIDLAQKVIRSGKILVENFDLTNQDVTKSKSICGGNTTILIEPFNKGISNNYRSILTDAKSSNSILLTKVAINGDIIVDRTIITVNTRLLYSEKVNAEVDKCIEKRKSNSIIFRDDIYLINYIGNQPVLHIFGAGHVGKAVAELAHFLELDTVVYDERQDLANSERFPNSIRINNDKNYDVINNAHIAQSDFVLVATRGHQHDFELMRWLLDKEIDYLSLMSSEKKWQLLSKALIDDGYSEENINKVYSPVGLDISSETVPEIAVSIIAEIINHNKNSTKSVISLAKKNE